MLLEKYVSAANEIVTEAVPTAPGSRREKVIPGLSSSGAASERR